MSLHKPDHLLPPGYMTRQEISLIDQPNDYCIVMGNKVYRFKNFKHPGGWSIHQPYAGGRLDASSVYMLKHGGSMGVKRSLDSYFYGYIVDDSTHVNNNLDDASWKLRWQPRGEGYPHNIIGYGAGNPFIPPLAKP